VASLRLRIDLFIFLSFSLCRADWNARIVEPTTTPDATAVRTSCARCDDRCADTAFQSTAVAGFIMIFRDRVRVVEDCNHPERKPPAKSGQSALGLGSVALALNHQLSRICAANTFT
jgi:hypothetical protein